MRSLNFVLAALLGLTAISALAQAPPVLDPAAPANGARPGHVPGVGESLPKSDKASNILPGNTRSDIAPTLPAPGVLDAGGPYDYLRAARAALTAGRTGEAQQSLEMAETRSLDRAMAPGQMASASDSRFVAQIREARRALGTGQVTEAVGFIDLALVP
jgi:hypothetical protein